MLSGLRLAVARGVLSRLAGETVTLASVRFSSVIVEPGRDPKCALLCRLVGTWCTLVDAELGLDEQGLSVVFLMRGLG